MRLGIGDDHGARPGDACRLQDLRTVGVAEDDVDALGAGLGNALRVDVESDEGNPFDGEEFRDAPAGAAIAADDHVLAQLEAMHRDIVDHRGLVRPVAAPQVAGQARGAGDQEGRDEHRHQHGGERDLERAEADQLELVGEPDQHQAELAALRQLGRCAQTGDQRRSCHPRNQQHYRGLAADQQNHGQQQLVDIGEHVLDVQHHADGDEEEAEQDVAKRADVGFDMVAVGSFGNKHAADEGAQCQRQSGLRGQEGKSDHDPQRGQHQQFARLVLCSGVENAAHQFLSQPDHQRQDGKHLGGGHGQRASQVFARRGQSRQQDQAGRNGKVLEQQHAHGLPPGTRVELEALGKHLGDDGCRRHRDCQSDGDAAAPALTVGQGGDQSGPQRRQRHLCRAEAEYQRAHGLQALQAELEADRKHQEDDAEFGKARNLGAFRQAGQSVRSQGHADRQIGEHRR